MISNQILQNTLDGLKNISRSDFCVADTEGKILAFTAQNSEISSSDILGFAASPADSQVVQENQFFKVYDENRLEYVLVVSGGSEDTYMIGQMAAFQIQNLLVDIYNRAKKLHIDVETKRVVFILETGQGKDYTALENVKNIFQGKKGDFITAVDEKSIIVVKEVNPGDGYAEMQKIAESILQAVREKDELVHIAYGTIVKELKEVSRSYKEARMALDVGKIFFDEKEIIAYSSLGIGRLIYQLPIPLCKMFIKEIFENKSPDDFDEETITTINKFFENSLNVSETSRQLYIHRNTLVYRLDKLQKSTGLDLRVFEDAITFKIALMVVRYMKYMETLDY